MELESARADLLHGCADQPSRLRSSRDGFRVPGLQPSHLSLPRGRGALGTADGEMDVRSGVAGGRGALQRMFKGEQAAISKSLLSISENKDMFSDLSRCLGTLEIKIPSSKGWKDRDKERH